jgi:hypothetical protein
MARESLPANETPPPLPPSIQLEELAKRRRRVLGIYRYVFESILLALVVFLLFAAWDYTNRVSLAQELAFQYDRSLASILRHPWQIVLLDINRYFILIAIVQTLSLLIFYGTSFEVTPLAMVRSMTRRLYRFTREDIEANKWIESRNKFEVLEADRLQKAVAWESKDSSDSPQPIKAKERPDLMHRILSRSASTSQDLAARMERRLNTYLILGILIGSLGLSFWWYVNKQTETATQPMPSSIIIENFLVKTLPKLTILLFIEVLAGFFLRQFRIGVEDFKYFLQLKRQADTNRLVYAFIEDQDDSLLRMKFLDALLAQLAITKADDTAKVMETAENPNIKLIDTLGGTANEAVKALATAAGNLKGK